MADYDAIVCGRGSNELAAAIRLAEAGWSGCLLGNDDLGGAARALESTLPGFKHDFGAAFFPLVAPSPSIVEGDLAPGLRLRARPAAGRPPLPRQPGDRPWRSVGETAASIDKVRLGDGAAWFALDEAFGEVMKHFLGPRCSAGRSRSCSRWRGGCACPGAGSSSPAWSSPGSAPSPTVVGQAQAFLTGPAMHADLQPEEPGTGIYALLLSMLGQRFGMPVVEGGATDPAALAAKARHDGVEIATGRRVDRIVVEQGQAVAVEAGGDTVSARRAVLCALDVGALVRLAGQINSAPGLAEVRHCRPGLGTFKVDWALDGQVPWAAGAAGPASSTSATP